MELTSKKVRSSRLHSVGLTQGPTLELCECGGEISRSVEAENFLTDWVKKGLFKADLHHVVIHEKFFF